MLSGGTCSNCLCYSVDCHDDGGDVVDLQAAAVVDFLDDEIMAGFRQWDLFLVYSVIVDRFDE